MIMTSVDIDGFVRAEAQALGRPCTLIDSAVLAGGVLVIIYEPEPFVYSEMDEVARERRCAVYRSNGTHICGTVVETRWEVPDGS